MIDNISKEKKIDSAIFEYRDVCTSMFLVAILIIVKKWNHPSGHQINM